MHMFEEDSTKLRAGQDLRNLAASLMRERDLLRADLARVTAERDEARGRVRDLEAYLRTTYGDCR
jgi:uncharacterized coiled-coil DUF342 family protein